MTMADPTVDPDLQGRIARLVTAAAAKARALVGRVRSAALVFAGAGVVFWAVLFYPFAYERVLAILAIGALLAALLVPSGVLYLFYKGLMAVVALPERLLDAAGTGATHARTAYRAAVYADTSPDDGRALRLVRAIRDLRALVGSSRELLVQYGVLFRMANPFVLAIVGIAVLAGSALVVAAAIALAVALL